MNGTKRFAFLCSVSTTSVCTALVSCDITKIGISVFKDISRGADKGSRAPPLGLNPMHILLYPRDYSSRKIMLTGKNGIQGAYQPFVYTDSHSTYSNFFRDMGN